MTADVQQCAHLEVLTAHDEQRLSTVPRGEEIARLTHLAVVPDTVPVAQEQPAHLTLEELVVAVELATQRVTRALGTYRPRAPFRALHALGRQCSAPMCQIRLSPKVRGRNV